MMETSDLINEHFAFDTVNPAHDAGKFDAPYVYQSGDITELLKAFSEAQKDMSVVSKDETNPFYDKDYATLASVITTTREPLTKNGLSIMQWIVNDHLVTFLGHKSGQYMQSAKRIVVKDKTNAQSEGSGITYARRYAMMSVLGLAPADDDGNTASGQVSVGDAMQKLYEANAKPHLANIWKKHEPEWKKLFPKDEMEKLIEIKNHLKAKFDVYHEQGKEHEESMQKAKELTDEVLKTFKGSKVIDDPVSGI